ncbi:hypothetical protein BJ912DRAFT_641967 [Pholiota molesta]|nr:hypothetical protein BJ912DRAFT_641967 [Pholiota molesta]
MLVCRCGAFLLIYLRSRCLFGRKFNPTIAHFSMNTTLQLGCTHLLALHCVLMENRRVRSPHPPVPSCAVASDPNLDGRPSAAGMHSMEVTDDMCLQPLHLLLRWQIPRFSALNTPSAVGDTLGLAGCSASYTSERICQEIIWRSIRRGVVEEQGSAACALVRMDPL